MNKSLLFLLVTISIHFALLAEETNVVYPEQNFRDTEGDFVYDRAKILVLNSNAPDSKPAPEDPGGNWGKMAGGIQLSVRFTKLVFTNGEPVIAKVIIRNVSEAKVRIDLEAMTFQIRDADDQIVETILEKKAKTPFEKNLARMKNGHGPEYVAPIMQRICFCHLDTEWDIARPGKYSIVACIWTHKDDRAYAPDKKSFSTREEYAAAVDNFLRDQSSLSVLSKSGEAHFEIR